jgi:hypothetical protein
VLPALSQRVRVAVLGTAAAAAAFFVFGGGRSSTGSTDPESAIPRDAYLVATMNLAELRRSPLYEVVFGKEPGAGAPRRGEVPVLSARALGIAKLADACGFDPLSRVDSLAVGVPEEGDKGELGVAARLTVSRDELSKCTDALAEQRGGKVDTKDVGGFVVVEDRSRPSESAPPRLGYGHGGLLVAGRGAWFDAMLATADGSKAGVRTAPGHAAVRTALTSVEGWRAPTVLVTALLPRSLRDRLKAEMGAELGTKDASQAIMAGVLGVSSVGLALRAGPTGGMIDCAVELFCDDDEACAAVEKLMLKKRLDWSKELSYRMVGLGPLLDSIEVKRDGAKLRVTAGAPADALTATIERVLRFTAHRSDAAPAPANAASHAPAAEPRDELIPAPRSAPSAH